MVISCEKREKALMVSNLALSLVVFRVTVHARSKCGSERSIEKYSGGGSISVSGNLLRIAVFLEARSHVLARICTQRGAVGTESR